MTAALRFAILRHETPPDAERGPHWDLLLERGEALATWALDEPPDASTPQSALKLAPHRPLYLDYEGPIRGGRGSVARWDGGVYETLAWSEACCVVRLQGARLRGVATLQRDAATQRWTFAFASE